MGSDDHAVYLEISGTGGKDFPGGGKRYRLRAAESLRHVKDKKEDLRKEFLQLKAPCTLSLELPLESINCGDDHVAAINLSRPFLSSDSRFDEAKAVRVMR